MTLTIANRPLPIVSQDNRFYLLQNNVRFSIGNGQFVRRFRL
jgi:hypothetical protein